MFKIFKNYLVGMAVYDKCHPPSIQSQWQALKDEAIEFFQDPSIDEVWDIFHSFGRIVCKLTGIPLQLLAWPTVRKHSLRYIERGCIRSRRNCSGYCCSEVSRSVHPKR